MQSQRKLNFVLGIEEKKHKFLKLFLKLHDYHSLLHTHMRGMGAQRQHGYKGAQTNTHLHQISL